MRLLGLACALALAATPVWAAPARWIGSWAASPAPPMTAPANNPGRGTPTFNNQTLAQVVRLSAGGQALRVRFTNEYGTHPLAIGGARVALLDATGKVLPGSERPLSFGGAATAVLPPGAPMLSDPVTLAVPTLARMRISLYLPSDTNGCTCHFSGSEVVGLASGDALGQPIPPGPAGPGGAQPEYRAFISAVEVETTAPPAPVIVAFGDSITDGYKSTSGADKRWPDRLAERLAARKGAAVNNAGIGGNRVISEALGIFGQSALTRFDRDVLSIPGATHVVVLEGVNDLGMGKPLADDVIAGYRQLIVRAHAHGLKIYGATILPYAGAAYFSPVGEAGRQKINAWIRTSHAFDAVIDFDAAIRDPAKPEKMKADLQSGDWLHPNDAGYRVMGDAVDLSLFR